MKTPPSRIGRAALALAFLVALALSAWAAWAVRDGAGERSEPAVPHTQREEELLRRIVAAARAREPLFTHCRATLAVAAHKDEAAWRARQAQGLERMVFTRFGRRIKAELMVKGLGEKGIWHYSARTWNGWSGQAWSQDFRAGGAGGFGQDSRQGFLRAPNTIGDSYLERNFATISGKPWAAWLQKNSPAATLAEEDGLVKMRLTTWHHGGRCANTVWFDPAHGLAPVYWREEDICEGENARCRAYFPTEYRVEELAQVGGGPAGGEQAGGVWVPRRLVHKAWDGSVDVVALRFEPLAQEPPMSLGGADGENLREALEKQAQQREEAGP